MLPLFTQGGGRAERGRWGRSWRDCSEAEKNEGGVSMKRSSERILTTHTGSLPRANDLTTLLEALDAGTVPEQAAFDARVHRAVADIVRQQVEAGVDVVNDGEQGKVGYSTYVRHRLAGFGGQAAVPTRADWADFPEAAAKSERRSTILRPACNGPIERKDRTAGQPGLPPDRLRLPLCWGNYEGPHHRDIPLKEILPIALKARPQALSFEGANPRHEHEWIVFRDIKLPDDRLIIPGVLDSTTNFVEHPELVAQRIVRYAEIVGRERVIAGTDCGMATFARSVNVVEPEIAWAKLKSMAEGARLASAQLWRSRS